MQLTNNIRKVRNDLLRSYNHLRVCQWHCHGPIHRNLLSFKLLKQKSQIIK